MKKFKDVEKLKSLLKINPFVNDITKNFNNLITRNEAKKLKIGDWLKKANNYQYYREYDDFEEGWNEISKYMTENAYECIPELKEMKMSKDCAISYCLNDIREPNYGMYLPLFYSQSIRIQNSFLNGIINNPNFSENFYCLKESIKCKIPIQKATKQEILNFYEVQEKFDELISICSYRECFDNKGNFIYSNYGKTSYNLDILEEELGKVILTGKRLFSETLSFVDYKFDSCILEKYNKKYTKIDLSEAQK